MTKEANFATSFATYAVFLHLFKDLAPMNHPFQKGRGAQQKVHNKFESIVADESLLSSSRTIDRHLFMKLKKPNK